LNVSNVPARVVTLSSPTTFDVPDRFHVAPAPALTSLLRIAQVLPTASGALMPVPSFGEYFQGWLVLTFQDRS